jgi:predicted PurR-regulated permease PerM
MTFSRSVVSALLPAADLQVVFHMIEANLITPTVVGRRLTINPLLILISLSFWGWVWGTPGALLAVPLLIIVKTVLAATGRPISRVSCSRKAR